MTNPTSPLASSLHVDTVGQGPPVYLLHSSGLSGRQWRRLATRLAGLGFQARIPDLTGHGASPTWPESEPFSYRHDVDLFVATLRREGPAHVVGHSYGGLVALLAALEAPTFVRSLVLFEPVAFGVLDPEADADALREIEGVAREWGTTGEEHEAWLQGFVDYWGGAGAWQALREEPRAEFRRAGWVVHEGVASLAGDRTRAGAYAALPMPVTLLTGESSPKAAGRVVAQLGRVIPNAEVVVLPGAGHMAPLSQGDRVNEIIVEALREASPN